MTAFASHDYRTLDGMRGIAAIGVLIYHFNDLTFVPTFKAGYLAVDLFFCLSGFVIAHAYEARLLGGMKLGIFTLTRLIRLWPMMALGIALGIVQSRIFPLTADPALLGASAPLVILMSFLFLPSYVGGGRMFHVNTPEWSIFYEIAINLFYAALIRFMSNTVLIVLMIVAFAFLAIGVFTLGTSNIGWAWSQLPFGLGRVTWSFFAGVLLYRFRTRFDGAFFRHRAWIPLLLTGIVLTLPVTRLLRPLFDCAFVAVGAPLLVWMGANSVPSDRFRALVTGLGTLSYPLYALHYPFYLAAVGLIAMAGGHSTAIAIAMMLAACAVSLWVVKAYDAPLRRRLSALAGLQQSARTRG